MIKVKIELAKKTKEKEGKSSKENIKLLHRFSLKNQIVGGG